MPKSYFKLNASTAGKLLAAILTTGLPIISAYADGPQRGYDDSDPRARSVSVSLDRDKVDLEAARRRVDAILAAREKQLNELSELRLGGRGQTDHARVDLDKATQDQARLRDQLPAIQKNVEAAQAKIEPIHAAALTKFEATDSFKAAFATFDKARQELKVPTDAVLDQLSQTREFQDLVAAARTAKATEDKLRDDKNADPKALAAAGDAFIAADNKVQDVEEKALTADPKIVEGRKRVDDAQVVLKSMRDQMEQDLLKDGAFSASVDELHRQQASLDAALADLKKLDAQVADLRGGVDQQPQVAPQDNRTALRDGEAKLQTINDDLAQARQDVSKFESRVQEDQYSLNDSRRDVEPPAPVYSDAPVYVPADRVAVYSPPSYYYEPAYDYGYDVSIGVGSYPSYYYNRYDDHRSYYTNRYYYGSRYDSRDREHRDYSYRDRLSYDRYDRSRDRSYTDHSSYRDSRDSRDTRPTVDHRTTSDYSGARTARDLHVPESTGGNRRSTSEIQPHNNSARAQEDVHGRRVTETPTPRSEPRQSSVESNRAAAHGPGADSPQPQDAPRHQETPRQQEAPRHQEAPHPQEAPRQQEAPRHQEAPRQQEPPRHQESPQPERSSPRNQPSEPARSRVSSNSLHGDSSDSTSRSHMQPR